MGSCYCTNCIVLKISFIIMTWKKNLKIVSANKSCLDCKEPLTLGIGGLHLELILSTFCQLAVLHLAVHRLITLEASIFLAYSLLATCYMLEVKPSLYSIQQRRLWMAALGSTVSKAGPQSRTINQRAPHVFKLWTVVLCPGERPLICVTRHLMHPLARWRTMLVGTSTCSVLMRLTTQDVDVSCHLW